MIHLKWHNHYKNRHSWHKTFSQIKFITSTSCFLFIFHIPQIKSVLLSTVHCVNAQREIVYTHTHIVRCAVGNERRSSISRRGRTPLLIGLITVVKRIKWPAPGRNSRRQTQHMHVYPCLNTNMYTHICTQKRTWAEPRGRERRDTA